MTTPPPRSCPASGRASPFGWRAAGAEGPGEPEPITGFAESVTLSRDDALDMIAGLEELIWALGDQGLYDEAEVVARVWFRLAEGLKAGGPESAGRGQGPRHGRAFPGPLGAPSPPPAGAGWRPDEPPGPPAPRR